MHNRKIYSSWLKKKILVQNIILIVLVIALGLFLYLKFKPIIISLPTRDECGPIGNTISHTIASDDACKSVCISACTSFKYSYYSSDYVYNSEVACNNCSCSCKK